jgi:uncharacterized protein YbdZ (MbtH family)
VILQCSIPVKSTGSWPRLLYPDSVVLSGRFIPHKASQRKGKTSPTQTLCAKWVFYTSQGYPEKELRLLWLCSVIIPQGWQENRLRLCCLDSVVLSGCSIPHKAIQRKGKTSPTQTLCAKWVFYTSQGYPEKESRLLWLCGVIVPQGWQENRLRLSCPDSVVLSGCSIPHKAIQKNGETYSTWTLLCQVGVLYLTRLSRERIKAVVTLLCYRPTGLTGKQTVSLLLGLCCAKWVFYTSQGYPEEGWTLLNLDSVVLSGYYCPHKAIQRESWVCCDS